MAFKTTKLKKSHIGKKTAKWRFTKGNKKTGDLLKDLPVFLCAGN